MDTVGPSSASGGRRTRGGARAPEAFGGGRTVERPRDAHLLGLPRGRPRLQAQEAGHPAVRRLRDRGAPARDVRGGGAPQPAPRPRRVPRRTRGSWSPTGRRRGARARRLLRMPIDHVVEMRRFDEAERSPPACRAAACTAATLVAVGRRLAEFHAAAAAPDGADCDRRAARRARGERRTRCSHSRPIASSRAGSPRSPASPRPSSHLAAASSRPVPRRPRPRRPRRPARRARAARARRRDRRLPRVRSPRSHRRRRLRSRVPASWTSRRSVAPDGRALGARRLSRRRRGPGRRRRSLAFFSVYRALVRAKVALVRGGPVRRSVRGCIAVRPRAARRSPSGFAWRARRPGLVVVAGLSATGKTRARLRCSPPAPACAISTPIRSASGCSASPRPPAPGRRPTARASTAAPMPSSVGSRGTSSSAAAGVLVDATFRRAADRAAFLGARRPAGRLGARRVPRARARPARTRPSPLG